MKVLILSLSFFSIFCFVLSAPTQSADCTNNGEVCHNNFEAQIPPILIRVLISLFIFSIIVLFLFVIFCFLCHTLDPNNQYMRSVCIGLLSCYCYQFIPQQQQQQQLSKRKKHNNNHPKISAKLPQGGYFRLFTHPNANTYKQPVSSVLMSI